jgi:hypothetical protein
MQNAVQLSHDFRWDFISSPVPSEESFDVNSSAIPSVLCAVCTKSCDYIEKSLRGDVSPSHKLVFEHVLHYDPVNYLASSAKEGCHLCTLILSYFKDHDFAVATLKQSTSADEVICLILQKDPIYEQYHVLPSLVTKIGGWLQREKFKEPYSMQGSILSLRVREGLLQI